MASGKLNSAFFLAPPSEVTDRYWLFASRKTGKYPEGSENSGKWLLFVPIEAVDAQWKKIRRATEKGLLGGDAKVSTAKPQPLPQTPGQHVICVYTYNCTDIADVLRVREALRRLGWTVPIPYKTDQATLAESGTWAHEKGACLFLE